MRQRPAKIRQTFFNVGLQSGSGPTLPRHIALGARMRIAVGQILVIHERHGHHSLSAIWLRSVAKKVYAGVRAFHTLEQFFR